MADRGRRLACLVGARGWDHLAWQGSFYPEDLPRDWRLSYYANEFQFVLVPADQWLHASEAKLIDWRDDTPASFRFYLEAGGESLGASTGQALRRAAAALGCQLGGVWHDGPLAAVDRVLCGEIVGPGRIHADGVAAPDGCCLCRLEREHRELPALRQLIERQQAAGVQQLGVIFPGMEGDPGLMQQTQILSQLLAGER